ncbi:galactose oxidase [Niabella insulamsoli]|uniref:galactose oxidase n=1 Tax=Niabella insulamsoli TaxID=3144874 RepID=UPI0031FD5BE8
MLFVSCKNQEGAAEVFQWSQLPQLPDRVGFAGSFAGVSNNHLIVAGGAQFPEGTRPWSGGVKTWHDQIWIFENETKGWKQAGKLPQAMGYGVSLSWRDGIILIGGADQQRHYADVYFLSYEADSLQIERMPSLPQPLANACGAIVGGVVYIAGGLSAPGATSTESAFLSLDLEAPASAQQWKLLPGWPGPPRMLSVAGAANGTFYLFSGAQLSVPPGDSVARRQYLNDAFAYAPETGWQQLKSLPHAVVAAPSPAYTDERGRLLVFGGDDGKYAGQNEKLKDKHPGFSKDILAYDPLQADWSVAGAVYTDTQPDPENQPNASTWAPVTTPLVLWKNHIVLPSGEVRPGVRTNRILIATPQK